MSQHTSIVTLVIADYRTLLCTGLFFIAFSSESIGQDSRAAKSPPPDAIAEASARRVVDEVFRPRLEAAKSNEEKNKIAKEMLNVAAETRNNLAGRYVLLSKTREVATATGNIDLAINSIDELAAIFNVEPLDLKTDALDSLPLESDSKSRPNATNFRKHLMQVLDQCLAAERYDLVSRLCDLGRSKVAKTASREFTALIEARRTEAQALMQQSREAQAALEVLHTHPTDPQANDIASNFYCFGKGDWLKGLPYLLRSSDANLRRLAEAESAEQKNAMRLADGWWQIASVSEGTKRRIVRARSQHWYRQALPTLSGLDKAKAEQRLTPISERRRSTGSNDEAALSAEVLSATPLGGVWRSVATDNEFVLTDNGERILVELKSGPTLISLSGELTRDGDALAAVRWEGVYKGDRNKQSRAGEFDGRVTAANRIVAKYTTFHFDTRGDLVGTTVGHTIWKKTK